MMQDLSVVYFSRATLIPGMGNHVHVHDYWHFSLVLKGTSYFSDNSMASPPICSCTPPGVPHAGIFTKDDFSAINVMFFARDEKLRSQLETFPFSHLKRDHLFLPHLEHILEQARTARYSPEFINSAFSYYLRLLMESNRDNIDVNFRTNALVRRCISYIEENYMNQIRLENISEYIGRTNSHTSQLVRSVTGMTVVENLNAVRIKHACAQLTYSNDPLEKVALSCGFTNVRHFSRVFKNLVGTSPNRYRTSHVANDMYYIGDPAQLEKPYQDLTYTYIPGAQKCIYWNTPMEYLRQNVEHE